MNPYIHSIETIVPPTAYTKEFARDFMKKHIGGDQGAVSRILHRIYAMSGIEKRHSVITEFQEGAPGGIYFDPKENKILNPATGDRNQRYSEVGRKLYTDLAQKTLNNSRFHASDVTHVITVSCTGFFAPGPDYYIVKSLGLPPQTRRYHLGFMGCYAAFPAMRIAQSICAEDPNAVVLIASLELCTLHLQFSTDTDALISGSVFADGGAGLIMSAQQPDPEKPALQLNRLDTNLTSEGEKDMAWTIGNSGFDMVLSTYVPEIIESNLSELLSPYLKESWKKDDFSWWAVHPGGRAILDKVEQSLQIDPEKMEPSRQTLRDYGNMSSATVLFVLKNILDRNPATTDPLIAMAFGPGLTVETGIFDILPAQNAQKKNQPKPAHAVIPA